MAQATERAYAAIRGGILDGTHALGARLREEELAGAIGVSRTPVREALRRLDAEGLVDFSPNRGAQVASWTDADLDEIFGLRALLESHGATLAAARVDRLDLEQLRELAERMEASLDDLARVAELNSAFHFHVVRAAASPRLEALLSSIVQVALVHRTFHRYTTEALERSMAHHRELVAALEAGDGEWAGSVMRSHVLAARAAIR